MALTEQQASEIEDLLPAMRRFARGLTGREELADDLVQDALTKALSNYDRYEQGTNLKAWLFRIVRNTHIDEMRKVQRRGAHVDVDDEEVVQIGVPGSQFSNVELLEFRRAFAKLSEEDREVLLLIGMEGHTYDEASEMIDVPVGTVKSRLSRARDRLRAAMTAPIPRRRNARRMPSGGLATAEGAYA